MSSRLLNFTLCDANGREKSGHMKAITCYVRSLGPNKPEFPHLWNVKRNEMTMVIY